MGVLLGNITEDADGLRSSPDVDVVLGLIGRGVSMLLTIDVMFVITYGPNCTPCWDGVGKVKYSSKNDGSFGLSVSSAALSAMVASQGVYKTQDV